jgi:hypothetical protein
VLLETFPAEQLHMDITVEMLEFLSAFLAEMGVNSGSFCMSEVFAGNKFAFSPHLAFGLAFEVAAGVFAEAFELECGLEEFKGWEQ